MTALDDERAAHWVCVKMRDDALAEVKRLRAALKEITDLCKREPANPFLADNMDRIAIAALNEQLPRGSDGK